METTLERENEIGVLTEKLSLLLAKRYRHSSEKLEALQRSLFDEAELQSDIDRLIEELAARGAKLDESDATDTGDGRTAQGAASAAKPNSSAASNGTAGEKPKRAPLPAHFRRVDIDIDVCPDDRQMMGDEWIQVGWETSEQLAIQEREAYVKVIRRAKYIRCAAAADPIAQPSAIKVAPPMPVILPKALADASLLAKIITGKLVDQKSFYREMKALERIPVKVISHSGVM